MKGEPPELAETRLPERAIFTTNRRAIFSGA
jgi:hypothetical protein